MRYFSWCFRPFFVDEIPFNHLHQYEKLNTSTDHRSCLRRRSPLTPSALGAMSHWAEKRKLWKTSVVIRWPLWFPASLESKTLWTQSETESWSLFFSSFWMTTRKLPVLDGFGSFCHGVTKHMVISGWPTAPCRTMAAATANIKTGKETIESCNRRRADQSLNHEM